MKELTSPADLQPLSTGKLAILLKHGPTCPISARARDEVAAFAGKHPDVPIYSLDVTGHRELSAQVATQFGVRHESPQLFVLHGGRVGWHAAHYDITADSIGSHLE